MIDKIEFELEVTADLDNYNRWIAEIFYPYTGGSLVEIGAGIGTFSALFTSKFEKLTLIEPSPKLFKHLKERFSDNNQITVKQHSLSITFLNSEKDRFNSALMVNVLEHIENDTNALKLLSDVLKPGGYLLIFVPALQSLYSDFDQAVGHYRRYHRKDLAQIVESAGFEIIKLKYVDWLGAAAWWFLNVVLQSKDINPKAARLYDRIGIPVTRKIESFIDPPFGKNLILIARKSVSKIK
jgi:SAM-dependent methyltransferase